MGIATSWFVADKRSRFPNTNWPRLSLSFLHEWPIFVLKKRTFSATQSTDRPTLSFKITSRKPRYFDPVRPHSQNIRRGQSTLFLLIILSGEGRTRVDWGTTDSSTNERQMGPHKKNTRIHQWPRFAFLFVDGICVPQPLTASRFTPSDS